MPRTDDSWDITEGVGTTALGIAAARAAETAGDNPIIQDPFARVFVEAAGMPMCTITASPTLSAQFTAGSPALQAKVRALVDFTAVRTAFFDEFFLDAAHAGVRQIVILAAGLDARAWRLPWPDGTTVYELDQPKVLEFKSATLQQHGALPRSNLVNVAVDLRKDWPTALREAGFDASQPTAWSAEGLLHYLPAWAQRILFERVQALSPVASWFALNTPSKDALSPDRSARQSDEMHHAVARPLQTEPPDLEGLWHAAVVTDWLHKNGWAMSTATLGELLVRHGRAIPDEDVMPTVFISAQRPAD
jgi:methyltransferase (TIGR00027 family)